MNKKKSIAHVCEDIEMNIYFYVGIFPRELKTFSGYIRAFLRK